MTLDCMCFSSLNVLKQKKNEVEFGEEDIIEYNVFRKKVQCCDVLLTERS